jgi:hypothetical protein
MSVTKRPRSPPGEPMTLGNMRENGVRSLDVMCTWLIRAKVKGGGRGK